MDFSHAIQFGGELTARVNSIDNIKDDAVYGLFPAFRKVLTREAIRHFASILGNVSRPDLEEAVELIPREWQVEPNVRSELVNYLVHRATFVAESIESRLFAPPQLRINLADGDES
jgi:hypothetical protein